MSTSRAEGDSMCRPPGAVFPLVLPRHQCHLPGSTSGHRCSRPQSNPCLHLELFCSQLAVTARPPHSGRTPRIQTDSCPPQGDERRLALLHQLRLTWVPDTTNLGLFTSWDCKAGVDPKLCRVTNSTHQSQPPGNTSSHNSNTPENLLHSKSPHSCLQCGHSCCKWVLRASRVLAALLDVEGVPENLKPEQQEVVIRPHTPQTFWILNINFHSFSNSINYFLSVDTLIRAESAVCKQMGSSLTSPNWHKTNR